MTVPEPMTITVGTKSGDLRGGDSRMLQAAVDYLYQLGGGVLQILPGRFIMRNALYLRPGVTVRGSGEDTVLEKAEGTVTELIQESDWYESRVKVSSIAGFSEGCGIMLRSKDEHGTMTVIKDTVTRIEGNVISLSKRLSNNMWPRQQATAATLFPLLTAEDVHDVRVEDLVLDGNRSANEEINGNYAGGVFIQHCDRHTYRNVESRSYNGDGFSFQVCDDIRMERCVSRDNANLGFHPGSGSQRPLIQECVSSGNSQGIFFCWGVSDGVVEDSSFSNNVDYGVTFGHRDTDNHIRNCTIEQNARCGVLFRDEGEGFLAAHRNTIESCTLRDNGGAESGIAIDMRREPYDVCILGNRFEDSGNGIQKIGVRIEAGVRRERIEDNTFHNMETDIQDERL